MFKALKNNKGALFYVKDKLVNKLVTLRQAFKTVYLLTVCTTTNWKNSLKIPQTERPQDILLTS